MPARTFARAVVAVRAFREHSLGLPALVGALAVSAAVGYGAARVAPVVVVPVVCLFVAVTIAASWSASRAPAVHGTPPPAEPTTASIRRVWWLTPGWAAAIGIAPGILLATFVPPEDFLANWRTPKFFDDFWLVVSLAMGAAFLIGIRCARSLRVSSPDGTPSAVRLSRTQWLRLQRGSQALFWLAVVGYATWTALAVKRGLSSGDVIAVFSGAPHAVDGIKDTYLEEVAGVTTLTQFGPVAAAGFYLLHRLDPRARGWWPYIAVLLVLGAGRAVLHAERLALIEVLVPLVVVGIAIRPAERGSLQRRGRLRGTALKLFPVVLPLLVVVVFGAFEYLRSWSYYRDHGSSDTYIGFTVDRLGAYYATGPNNSVLLLDSDARRAEVPYYSTEWLWSFPLVSDVVRYRQLTGSEPLTSFTDALEGNANPEFNNTGGLLLPVFDWGIAGAAVFWLLLGIGVGATYLRFRAGDPRAVLLYSVGFIGLLELSRIVYWPQGRAFPALVGAIALGAYVRSGGTRTERLNPGSATATRAVRIGPRRAPT